MILRVTTNSWKLINTLIIFPMNNFQHCSPYSGPGFPEASNKARQGVRAVYDAQSTYDCPHYFCFRLVSRLSMPGIQWWYLYYETHYQTKNKEMSTQFPNIFKHKWLDNKSKKNHASFQNIETILHMQAEGSKFPVAE